MGTCQITKYRINLDLFDIIQFCLKIYDLWRHPHLWVDVWMLEWMGGSKCRMSTTFNIFLKTYILRNIW